MLCRSGRQAQDDLIPMAGSSYQEQTKIPVVAGVALSQLSCLGARQAAAVTTDFSAHYLPRSSIPASVLRQQGVKQGLLAILMTDRLCCLLRVQSIQIRFCRIASNQLAGRQGAWWARCWYGPDRPDHGIPGSKGQNDS